MGNVLLSVISILVGVGATILAARYYYRRSVDKELTPFMQFQSNVLDYIDDEVKSDLDIEYKGVKVDRLQQIQFLIANTGERAIKELIKPLKLKINGEIEIMDANILHIHPTGREVNLNLDKENNIVDLDFPLLNKDDFFVVKFLINGAPKRSDYQFSIVADDLPPKLNILRLGYHQIASDKEEGKEKGKFGYGEFSAGLVFFFLTACIGLLSYYSNGAVVPSIQSTNWAWLNAIPFATIASWVGYLITALFGFIGIALVRGAFGEFEFPKSKKFVLPKEIATGTLGPEFFIEAREYRAANKAIKEDPS